MYDTFPMLRYMLLIDTSKIMYRTENLILNLLIWFKKSFQLRNFLIVFSLSNNISNILMKFQFLFLYLHLLFSDILQNDDSICETVIPIFINHLTAKFLWEKKCRETSTELRLNGLGPRHTHSDVHVMFIIV